jgi:hypothetical protein
MKLAQMLRENIDAKFVKDGDSWSKARRGYSISLSQHLTAIGTMANWLHDSDIYPLMDDFYRNITD